MDSTGASFYIQNAKVFAAGSQGVNDDTEQIFRAQATILYKSRASTLSATSTIASHTKLITRDRKRVEVHTIVRYPDDGLMPKALVDIAKANTDPRYENDVDAFVQAVVDLQKIQDDEKRDVVMRYDGILKEQLYMDAAPSETSSDATIDESDNTIYESDLSEDKKVAHAAPNSGQPMKRKATDDHTRVKKRLNTGGEFRQAISESEPLPEPEPEPEPQQEETMPAPSPQQIKIDCPSPKTCPHINKLPEHHSALHQLDLLALIDLAKKGDPNLIHTIDIHLDLILNLSSKDIKHNPLQSSHFKNFSQTLQGGLITLRQTPHAIAVFSPPAQHSLHVSSDRNAPRTPAGAR